jgi:hypothetical protein
VQSVERFHFRVVALPVQFTTFHQVSTQRTIVALHF